MEACRSLHIKCGVHAVNVRWIQLFPQLLNAFAEALEVDDLPFPEKFDHIIHIRIVRQPKNVVIGHSGLLLCQGVP